jgi:hypothetical protein
MADEPTSHPEVTKPKADLPIGGLLFAIIFAIALLFATVGTGVSWARYWDASIKSDVYLWQQRNVDNFGIVTTTKVADIPCDNLRQRFRGAEAFAIITIFGALVAFIAGILGTATGSPTGRILGLIFAAWTFGSSLITWGIGYNVYYKSFCGTASLFEQHYQIYAGGALFVAVWVLSFVGFIIYLVDPVAPVGERATRVGYYIFTLLFLVAFIFSVVGTTTNQMVQNNTIGETEVTLWSIQVHIWSSITARQYFRNTNGCKDLVDLMKAAESFAIISIATTLAALIAGLGLLYNAKARAVAFVSGFAATASMVIVWGIVARTYHKTSWCQIVPGLNSPADERFFFGPGFALFVTGWVAATIATFVLVMTIISARLNANKANIFPIRPVTILFVFFMFVSLIFCIVGCFEDVIRKTSTTSTSIEITWWRVYQSNTAQHTNMKVTDAIPDCANRFRAGEAFSVMACVFAAVAFILGFLQLSVDTQRVPASIAGLVASVFQLITFAMALALYHGDLCNFGTSPAHDDYNIGAGTGLFISAWCFTLFFSVLNLVVA